MATVTKKVKPTNPKLIPLPVKKPSLTKPEEVVKPVTQLATERVRINLMDIELHPRNPRRGKVSLIKESIKKNGYYPSVMLQKSRNRAIKGNNTVKALRELNVEEKYQNAFDEIDVDVLDCSDAHALRIVLMDNRSSDESGYDNNDLYLALKEVDKIDGNFFGTGYTQDDFDYLLRVTGNSSLYDEAKQQTDAVYQEPKEVKKEDVPDAVWPSDSTELILSRKGRVISTFQAGVPQLSLKMQCTAFDLPFLVWGTQRGRKMKKGAGTYVFYTTDDHLEGIWRNPAAFLQTSANNAIEVNFSVYPQTPPIVALNHTYRKRWISRYWQSQGRQIIVDMFVPEEFWEMNLLGIPKGWKAWATRADVAERSILDKYHQFACKHAGTDDILFVLYGGGDSSKNYAAERNWLWVPEELAVQRGTYIEESIKPKGKKVLV